MQRATRDIKKRRKKYDGPLYICSISSSGLVRVWKSDDGGYKSNIMRKKRKSGFNIGQHDVRWVTRK